MNHIISKLKQRNSLGFSLIEVMTVIAVLAIVLGLLFAYQDEGWKLFYQSYTRGLSQVKAKLAVKLITNELREANKTRIAAGRGIAYGIPFPDDAINNSPYLYFTKPIIHINTGEPVGYDYVLFYFAKPKTIKDLNIIPKEDKYSVLKSIKFLNQSKYFTEDTEKTWPFLPPLIELQKSKLPEDEELILSLAPQGTETPQEGESQEVTPSLKEEQFLDHFARLKKESRNIPIGDNFLAQPLTDPFSKQDVNISFGFESSNKEIVKIKVFIEEPPMWFGLMSSASEFEVAVTPRN